MFGMCILFPVLKFDLLSSQECHWSYADSGFGKNLLSWSPWSRTEQLRSIVFRIFRQRIASECLISYKL